MTDTSGPLPELRASDADREQVVEVLRRAASAGQVTVDELEQRVLSAYGARTYGELELLTHDLSADLSGTEGTATEAHGNRFAVREGRGGTRWVISIMGGHSKRGGWRIAPRCTVLNLMGASDIDLNDAELSDSLTELTLYSIMGGSEIRVPVGVDVQVSDFALLGGNDVRLGERAAPPGAPTLHIRLVSILGGCGVARGRKRTWAERRRERQLRKARRRDL
jgi:hypothetical protein